MDRELYEKLLAWMNAHRDDIVADIKSLASISSVSVYNDPPYPYGRGVKAALDKALEIGAGYGFDAENYEDYCGSLFFNATGDANAPFIGFWEHMDVVPEGSGWLFTKPYEPIEYNGSLIGRGVEDNKGPAICVLAAMRALRELHVPLKHNLKLFVGCDEEHGMSDCEHFSAAHPNGHGVLSIIADSEFPVNYGEKGIIECNLVSKKKLSDAFVSVSGGLASNIIPPSATATLKRSGSIAALPEGVDYDAFENEVVFSAHGQAAHSSMPHLGVNAIGRLTKALIYSGILSEEDAAILALPDRINDTADGAAVGIVTSDQISGKLTCAGTMTSLRDGHFVLHLNIRYPVTESGERLLANINKMADEGGYTVELIQDNKPNYYPPESPIVPALTNLYNEITGDNKPPFVMAGGTYARKLPNAIGFGMGIPGGRRADWLPEGHGGPHEPDEHIDVNLALRAAAIFAMGIVTADGLIN
ncbi:MAG: Sapep family Mn(2+)-dependent dipeptidase [Oscillospiraceae bacterium]|nr:Sapep family Mn(2+)-dependent dipeptidase [Oscillospiraceae bacterium]